MKPFIVCYLCLWFDLNASFTSGWTLTTTTIRTTTNLLEQQPPSTTTATPSSSGVYYQPIFQFPKDIEWIDRLDDVIMGGISTSSVQPSEEGYARWIGVCRTDGGGFCGFRTNPFVEPLIPNDENGGFYVTCRLVSDNEPERRVWKMTTRTRPDRGELLYQAPVNLTAVYAAESSSDSPLNTPSQEFRTIQVPFSEFRYVRGPRMVPGPPLNVSAGLYQIGMTMSKFAFAPEPLEINNFRDGFFELQIREIGLYKHQTMDSKDEVAVQPPKILTKSEAKTLRPLLIKILSPVSRLFFSEQSQRRKSAMRILREERNLSRGQAIRWGLKNRAKTCGLLRSICKTVAILAVDAFRATFATALRLFFIYPFRLARKASAVMTTTRKRDSEAGEISMVK